MYLYWLTTLTRLCKIEGLHGSVWLKVKYIVFKFSIKCIATSNKLKVLIARLCIHFTSSYQSDCIVQGPVLYKYKYPWSKYFQVHPYSHVADNTVGINMTEPKYYGF